MFLQTALDQAGVIFVEIDYQIVKFEVKSKVYFLGE